MKTNIFRVDLTDIYGCFSRRSDTVSRGVLCCNTLDTQVASHKESTELSSQSWTCRSHCFCFQNYMKYFLDTLIQIFFLITKMHIFRVDLTDISAIKEPLVGEAPCHYPTGWGKASRVEVHMTGLQRRKQKSRECVRWIPANHFSKFTHVRVCRVYLVLGSIFATRRGVSQTPRCMCLIHSK